MNAISKCYLNVNESILNKKTPFLAPFTSNA